MLNRLFLIIFFALSLQGCVVGAAVGVAGDVAEGAANVTIGTVKTTGKVADAVLPGGGDTKKEENQD